MNALIIHITRTLLIMKRRQFLTLGLQSAAILSTSLQALTAMGEELLNEKQNATFVALIDTLIPKDETPSASGLNLDQKLIAYARTVHNYPELIVLGCQWLDAQANTLTHQFFHQLLHQQRVDVVKVAETSAPGSIPKQFFDHVKDDLFNFYYADPAVWASLGLHGAPQPYGYVDYMHAPKKTS